MQTRQLELDASRPTVGHSTMVQTAHNLPGIGEFRSRQAHPPLSLHPQAHGIGHGRHDALSLVGGDEGIQGTAGTRHPERPDGQCSLEARGSSHSGRADELATIGTTHCQNGGRTATLKAAGLLAASFTVHDRYGYMVARMLAWLMAGADHYDIEFIVGSLTHAVKSFISLGPAFRLASSLPWRSSLLGWDHKQTDVALVTTHLTQGCSTAMQKVTWEARTLTRRRLQLHACW